MSSSSSMHQQAPRVEISETPRVGISGGAMSNVPGQSAGSNAVPGSAGHVRTESSGSTGLSGQRARPPAGLSIQLPRRSDTMPMRHGPYSPSLPSPGISGGGRLSPAVFMGEPGDGLRKVGSVPSLFDMMAKMDKKKYDALSAEARDNPNSLLGDLPPSPQPIITEFGIITTPPTVKGPNAPVEESRDAAIARLRQGPQRALLTRAHSTKDASASSTNVSSQSFIKGYKGFPTLHKLADHFAAKTDVGLGLAAPSQQMKRTRSSDLIGGSSGSSLSSLPQRFNAQASISTLPPITDSPLKTEGLQSQQAQRAAPISTSSILNHAHAQGLMSPVKTVSNLPPIPPFTGYHATNVMQSPPQRQRAMEDVSPKKKVTVDASEVSKPVQESLKLAHTWTLYFDNKNKSVATMPVPPSPTSSSVHQDSYEAGLNLVGTFSTVESFARTWNWIKAPSAIERNSNYHFFKDKIKPMWEDPANASGGKWVITMRNNPVLLDKCWTWLILGLVGQDLDADDQVTGAVVSTRPKTDRIQVWTRSKEPVAVLNAMGQKIINLLGLQEEAVSFEFQFNHGTMPANAGYHAITNLTGLGHNTGSRSGVPRTASDAGSTSSKA